MGKEKDMNPVSHERVEVDGIYTNESGQEEHLHRGQTFPANVVLGTTEWELKEYMFGNHHEGKTDPRLVSKKDEIENQKKQVHPRLHQDQSDK
ncbi:transposase [Paenibacillus terrigena]|uniref:transposase n=1 Tax=Paenibacillus terrigena TaxID=369333 RepID=UPI0028D2CEB6|nr:transposase [Paenibacillus terrigena]